MPMKSPGSPISGPDESRPTSVTAAILHRPLAGVLEQVHIECPFDLVAIDILGERLFGTPEQLRSHRLRCPMRPL